MFVPLVNNWSNYKAFQGLWMNFCLWRNDYLHLKVICDASPELTSKEYHVKTISVCIKYLNNKIILRIIQNKHVHALTKWDFYQKLMKNCKLIVEYICSSKFQPCGLDIHKAALFFNIITCQAVKPSQQFIVCKYHLNRHGEIMQGKFVSELKIYIWISKTI